MSGVGSRDSRRREGRRHLLGLRDELLKAWAVLRRVFEREELQGYIRCGLKNFIPQATGK